MKVYQICEILDTDDIYIVNRENETILHIEGSDAKNAAAILFERCDVLRLVPTRNAVEMTIDK